MAKPPPDPAPQRPKPPAPTRPERPMPAARPERPIIARPERPAPPPRPERPAKPERPPKPTKPVRPLSVLDYPESPLDPSLYPGDLEGDAVVEMGQLEAGFRQRMAAEAERRTTATQTGFYAVLVLETEDQMSAFLAGLGVKPGDGDLFVDARPIADRLGIKLPEAKIAYQPGGKLDGKLAKLVRV